MAKSKTFHPFNSWVIHIAWSNEKPRHWFHVINKDGRDDKTINYIALQKPMLGPWYAYRLILGPLLVMISRPTWRNPADALDSNSSDQTDHVGSNPTVGTKDGTLN